MHEVGTDLNSAMARVVGDEGSWLSHRQEIRARVAHAVCWWLLWVRRCAKRTVHGDRMERMIGYLAI